MLTQSGLYFAVRFVNGTLSIATLAVLTRLLDPVDYGVYSLGMAAILTLATVSFQWLSVSIARFHAAYSSSEDSFLTEMLRTFAFVCPVVAVGAIFWSLIRPIEGQASVLVVIVAAGAVALGFHDFHLQVAISRAKPIRYGVITATRGLLALLFATLLIKVGSGGAGALAGFGLACFAAILIRGERWTPRRHSDAARLRGEVLSYGLPFAMTSVMSMILCLSDRFVIGWYHGPAMVAGYAAAYDLAQQSIGAVLNIFLLASYPRITAAWETNDAAAVRESMAPLLRGQLLAGPFVVGVMVGMPSEISALVFGPSLRSDAATIMPWIACAIGVGYTKLFLFDVALHLSKAAGTLFAIAASTAVVNVTLNLALVPKLGILGSGIAAMAAFSLGAFLSWNRGRNVGVYPRVGKELFKAALAFAVLVICLRTAASVPMPEDRPTALLDVATLFLLAVSVYGLAALFTDLGQVRTGLLYRWRLSRGSLP